MLRQLLLLLVMMMMMMMMMMTAVCLQLRGESAADGVQDGGGGGGVGGGDTLRHTAGLMRRLEALLALGNGSDVSLRVETPGADEVKTVHAHSLVLSLQSAVFQELLLRRNSSTLVLTESAACAAAFHAFIRYLYCGDISLRLDQATPLHMLASRYQVLSLQQGVSHYMIQKVARDAAAGHVASWYEYALQAGDVALRDGCLQYLAWNLSSVLQSGEWLSVSGRLLMSLLRRSDLVLHSEAELFAALEAWILRNQPDGLTAENALRAVRYAMMAPGELFRLQSRSAVLTRYQESVRDLLYLSYQFHSASPPLMAKYLEVNCSLFVPRNYLSAAWGAAWTISHPARDDRSTSFQTQLGPSGHDANKRVTWNALFSPRWLPLAMRPMYTETGAMPASRLDGGRPRISVTPATSSSELAGVTFLKTVLVMCRRQEKLVVKEVYSFHQTTEENGDFLADAHLHQLTSEYLTDGALYLHIVVKPLYQSLITLTSH